MSSVTGSKQYRSVVVQERPGRRVAVRLAVTVSLILTGVVAYWAGAEIMLTDYRQMTGQNRQLQADLTRAQTQLAVTRQKLANQSVDSKVDRKTVEEVQDVVRDREKTIAKMKEEISFYKGLMAPTERERGLGIRSWEVYPTNDPTRFQYKLVVQQLAVKHNVLTGDVTVTLVGRKQGAKQSYTLETLSKDIKNKGIRLHFKYFQYIDGELQLPQGFVVDRVDIVAHATAPKVAKVEKQYGWIVQQMAGI